MSDLELLFLVLAVVYGWECACWTRRGSVALRTWLGRRWRVAHPAALLGNQQGGLVLAAPLPPLGWLLSGSQFPLSLSSEGVLAYVAPAVNPGGRPAQTGKWLRWEQLQQVETRGKKVLVNGELLVKTASGTFALGLAEELRALGKLKAKEREQAIGRKLAEAFDGRAAKQRWEESLPELRQIRLLGNTLLGWLFVAAPVLIWCFGLSRCWPGLLAGVLACTVSVAWSFRRAHRRLFPLADEERFTHFLVVLLSPASTVRAHDLLTRPLLETYHPLTLAKLFLRPEDFKAAARMLLRELRHPALPVCPSREPATVAAEQQARSRLLSAAEGFCKRNGLKPDELLAPPAPADETCRSYCPRCLEQFVALEGNCADCGGLPLEPLSRAIFNKGGRS